MDDDEGIKKYFAAFHLHDTFPAAVVIDDFGNFFQEKYFSFIGYLDTGVCVCRDEHDDICLTWIVCLALSLIFGRVMITNLTHFDSCTFSMN